MGTTLIRDDDVSAKLKTEAQRAFKITARDLGNLKPGLSLDHIAGLIERVEGALHR
jgi:hypothetical protein